MIELNFSLLLLLCRRYTCHFFALAFEQPYAVQSCDEPLGHSDLNVEIVTFFLCLYVWQEVGMPQAKSAADLVKSAPKPDGVFLFFVTPPTVLAKARIHGSGVRLCTSIRIHA